MSTSRTAAGAARSTVRKWVLGALAAGVVTTAIGAGTFASFSASTNNGDNVFSTGRVELSNTKQSGTTCVSGHVGPGGFAQADLDANDNDCASLIDLALRSPGQSAEGRVALENTGDYDGLLQVFVPGAGCTNATVALPAGSGNLCSKLEVYIQQTQSNYTTPVTGCVFPASGSNCAPDFGADDDSLTDLASAAAVATPLPSSPLALDQGVTRYFTVHVNFRNAGFDLVTGDGLDNLYQNRSASFGLTWRLKEA